VTFAPPASSLHVRTLTAVLTAAAVLVAAAPAGAVPLTPAGTGAQQVTVTPGRGPQAVLAWRASGPAGDALQVTPFAGGRFGPVQTVLQAPAIGPAPFVALDPAGAIRVLGTRGTRPNLPTDLVDAVRAPAAPAFGAPAVLATGLFAQVLSAGVDARGDVAAIVSTTSRHAQLVTAPAGGAFGPPQDVSADGGFAETAAVGVGPEGRLVVAYHDGVSRAFVRTGAIGAALGPPQLLVRTRNRPDFSAAVDAAGNATVAFSRTLPGNRIGIAAARARAGAPFGPVTTLDRGPNAQEPQVAAAGATTAVAWNSLTTSDRVRVAVARGAGRFAAFEAPAARPVRLRGEAGRFPSEAGTARVAVDPAGDVLVAYRYGPFGAVHATERRAGSPRFAGPRVVSALGHGGPATVALLDDGRPVVAYADGDRVFAATRVDGTSVDRTPPGLTLTPLRASELRRSGTATTTARCSRPCVIQALGRLTTGRGPGRGQVIARPFVRPQVLAANTPLRLRIALTPAGRSALAATGRAQVRITVTAANASGAARTARVAFDVGRRAR
jgi:hypothetical protein